MPDDILSLLASEGHELDLTEPVIDIEATIRRLKRMKVEIGRIRLPASTISRRRKLAEICARYGVDPVWGD